MTCMTSETSLNRSLSWPRRIDRCINPVAEVAKTFGLSLLKRPMGQCCRFKPQRSPRSQSCLSKKPLWPQCSLWLTRSRQKVKSESESLGDFRYVFVAVLLVLTTTVKAEDARRTYMGRIVAQPMSHLGADWLIRPQRQQEEDARAALAALELQPGQTIVDLGCGNGFWTLPMAKLVASGDLTPPNRWLTRRADVPLDPGGELQGLVIAVDIQPEMLRLLRQNADAADVRNVAPVLGEVDDPRLPADSVDLVLMVDVYHEFSHPESMLASIRQSLEPEGVVALLEYRAEDPTVPIKPLHKMAKLQIMAEYRANGFKLVREVNTLPWQHLMFFARDDSPLPAIEPQ